MTYDSSHSVIIHNKAQHKFTYLRWPRMWRFKLDTKLNSLASVLSLLLDSANLDQELIETNTQHGLRTFGAFQSLYIYFEEFWCEVDFLFIVIISSPIKRRKIWRQFSIWASVLKRFSHLTVPTRTWHNSKEIMF